MLARISIALPNLRNACKLDERIASRKIPVYTPFHVIEPSPVPEERTYLLYVLYTPVLWHREAIDLGILT